MVFISYQKRLQTKNCAKPIEPRLTFCHRQYCFIDQVKDCRAIDMNWPAESLAFAASIGNTRFDALCQQVSFKLTMALNIVKISLPFALEISKLWPFSVSNEALSFSNSSTVFSKSSVDLPHLESSETSTASLCAVILCATGSLFEDANHFVAAAFRPFLQFATCLSQF